MTDHLLDIAGARSHELRSTALSVQATQSVTRNEYYATDEGEAEDS
jgi:hypothetical protein